MCVLHAYECTGAHECVDACEHMDVGEQMDECEQVDASAHAHGKANKGKDVFCHSPDTALP